MKVKDLVKVLKDNDSHFRLHYAGDLSLTFTTTSVYDLDRLRVEVEKQGDERNLVASIMVEDITLDELAGKIKEMCKYKYKPFKRRIKRIVEDVCNASLITN